MEDVDENHLKEMAGPRGARALSPLRVGVAEENYVGVGMPAEDGQVPAIGRPLEFMNLLAGEMGELVAARAIERILDLSEGATKSLQLRVLDIRKGFEP